MPTICSSVEEGLNVTNHKYSYTFMVFAQLDTESLTLMMLGLQLFCDFGRGETSIKTSRNDPCRLLGGDGVN